MARFYGNIGYAETVETRPGIWEEEIVEREYYGDVIRNTMRMQTTDQVNDNLVVTTTISVIADPYAMDHFHNIRYVAWMGAKWKVPTVDANQRPRLILTLGGVYNG